MLRRLSDSQTVSDSLVCSQEGDLIAIYCPHDQALALHVGDLLWREINNGDNLLANKLFRSVQLRYLSGGSSLAEIPEVDCDLVGRLFGVFKNFGVDDSPYAHLDLFEVGPGYKRLSLLHMIECRDGASTLRNRH